MKITAYTDATALGGAEVVLRTLVGALDESFHLTVVGTDASVVAYVAAERPSAATLLVPPVTNKFAGRAIVEHVRAVRALQPDVFHANLRTPWSSQYGLLGAVLTPGTKIVAVEHAPLPPANERQRFLRSLLVKRFTVHIGVAEAAARMIEGYLRLDRNSIRVVHNGVKDVVVRPMPRPVEGPIVGSIGRLAPEKGFDLLIRALALVPEATVLLVGDGPERAALERLAGDLGVGGRVIFMGWREDARHWLSVMDVFVAPSRVEAFGLGILEAMLTGVPVIAADVGGTREAIIDDETGLLVPPDDPSALAAALTRLLADEVRQERFTHLARRLVMTEFTPEIMARRFEAIYREIAA